MAPAVPTYVFCSPNDVYDYLSPQATQLHLDDDRQGTGYTITVVANAAQGATTLSVTALQSPLLPGSQLVFEGAAMEEAVTAVVSAVAQLGATTLSVAALSGPVNANATARDAGINVVTARRLLKGVYYGTARVKRYCQAKYDDSLLAQCWSVNEWATIFAGYWVATRVCRPCPKSIQEDCDRVTEECRQVMTGIMRLEDIPTRSAGWPFVSNVTVNPAYTVAKTRVEPQISENSITQFPQFIDWSSAFLIEAW